MFEFLILLECLTEYYAPQLLMMNISTIIIMGCTLVLHLIK